VCARTITILPAWCFAEKPNDPPKKDPSSSPTSPEKNNYDHHPPRHDKNDSLFIYTKVVSKELFKVVAKAALSFLSIIISSPPHS